MSPGKARSVLGLMDGAYERGLSTVRPDESCFLSVLRTAAGRPELSNIGPLADEMLALMKERHMLPDGRSYAAAIRTWRNCVLHPEFSDDKDRVARLVLDLLKEMLAADGRSTTVSVVVHTANVNDVMETVAASRLFRRVDAAEALLHQMEESLSQGVKSSFPPPNSKSYRLMFDIYGSSALVDRVSRATDVLHRMLTAFRGPLAGSEKAAFITQAYNAYIRVCGSSQVASEEEGMEVLRIALIDIERMREIDGFSPDADTYSSILECCGSLVPSGINRASLVERVFQLCCQDGMVDENVLTQLRALTSIDQYARLVIAKSSFLEGTKMVPEEWTINALGGRVVTEDGRRAPPLSIEGRLTVTMGMQDFKMRRLKDKRNRNLLQGGRLEKSGHFVSAIN
jgi:hypothetical protein